MAIAKGEAEEMSEEALASATAEVLEPLEKAPNPDPTAQDPGSDVGDEYDRKSDEDPGEDLEIPPMLRRR
jgi:hypothetical protein